MKTTVILVRHAECVGNILKDEYVQARRSKPDHLPEYANSRLGLRGHVQSYLMGRDISEICGKTGGRVEEFFVSGLIRSWQTQGSASKAIKAEKVRLLWLPCLNELSKCNVVKQAQRIKDKLHAGAEFTLQDECELVNLVTYYRSFYELMYFFTSGDKPTEYWPLNFTFSVEAYLAFCVRYPEFAEGKTPDLKDGKGFQDFKAYLQETRQWLEEHLSSEWVRNALDEAKDLEEEISAMLIPCDDGEELEIYYKGEEMRIFFGRTFEGSVRGQIESAFRFAANLGEKMGSDESPIKVVITHAKRLIRLRQEIEGFDEAEYQRLAKLNSKDFPQNVSMTRYEYEDGRWTRIGEPYQLPKGLAIREGTRRLGFELERSDFESICAKLDLDPKEVEDPLLDRLS